MDKWQLDNITIAHIFRFTAAILHGDDEHKEWLIRSADEYVRTGKVLKQKNVKLFSDDLTKTLIRYLEDKDTNVS